MGLTMATTRRQRLPILWVLTLPARMATSGPTPPGPRLRNQRIASASYLPHRTAPAILHRRHNFSPRFCCSPSPHTPSNSWHSLSNFVSRYSPDSINATRCRTEVDCRSSSPLDTRRRRRWCVRISWIRGKILLFFAFFHSETWSHGPHLSFLSAPWHRDFCFVTWSTVTNRRVSLAFTMANGACMVWTDGSFAGPCRWCTLLILLLRCLAPVVFDALREPTMMEFAGPILVTIVRIRGSCVPSGTMHVAIERNVLAMIDDAHSSSHHQARERWTFGVGY